MWIRAPRTVTAKLNVYIGATTSALLILTVWVSYYNSKSLVESQTNAEKLKEVQSLAGKMDDFVIKMAEMPNAIALHQQSLGAEPNQAMLSFLAALVIVQRLFREFPVVVRLVGAFVVSITLTGWVNSVALRRGGNIGRASNQHQFDNFVGCHERLTV